MATVSDIKRRIRSVKSTQQITKAMKMVAAAKLRRTQGAVVAARPYSAKLKEVLSRLVASSPDLKDPLLEIREPKKVGFVVVSANKGLSAATMLILLKSCCIHGPSPDQEIGVLAVGKKPGFFPQEKLSGRR